VRILITGSHGMLGQDVVARFRGRHELYPLTRQDADFTVYPQIAGKIEGAKPEVVMHLAAFTAVDDCETRRDTALQINSEGTRNVALACREFRVPMLYISTDYVFDGEKAAPYLEDDATGPINVYGQSKLQGEKQVAELLDRYWIVRTSWLFGPMGRNFVRAILEKARNEGRLRVVNDQVGAPTYTADLAEKLEEIVQRAPFGIYHVTNQGFCSWFDFAREILRQAGLGEIEIAPIPTLAAGRPAPRPRNSRLENKRLELEGLGLLPKWQDALRRYLLRETAVTA
jgi:dTDP-4-dehydrorhamnose reductase